MRLLARGFSGQAAGVKRLFKAGTKLRLMARRIAPEGAGGLAAKPLGLPLMPGQAHTFCTTE
ncbi:MAG: hypothetical protein RR276_06320, partial [Angelakisella sp.]